MFVQCKIDGFSIDLDDRIGKIVWVNCSDDATFSGVSCNRITDIGVQHRTQEQNRKISIIFMKTILFK